MRGQTSQLKRVHQEVRSFPVDPCGASDGLCSSVSSPLTSCGLHSNLMLRARRLTGTRRPLFPPVLVLGRCCGRVVGLWAWCRAPRATSSTRLHPSAALHITSLTAGPFVSNLATDQHQLGALNVCFYLNTVHTNGKDQIIEKGGKWKVKIPLLPVSTCSHSSHSEIPWLCLIPKYRSLGPTSDVMKQNPQGPRNSYF